MAETDRPTERGGFWTTIPGVLTALATLVTAVFGAYVGLNQLKKDDGPPQVAPAPAPAPPSGDTYIVVDPSALQAVAESDLASADPVDACANGDRQACVVVLDTLSGECGGANWEACDALFELAPEGSEYEVYGRTCGGVDEGENASACALEYG